MLYKKNLSQKLDLQLFKNPTAEYRATPFWAWNSKLEKDQLLRQIEQFKQMGFGGFHMHSRIGLATEYLSDEFMDIVKACCDKAESEHMLAWLYDEDKWPSGFGGGKVTAIKKFRHKRLALYPEDKNWNMPKAAALEAGEPYLLACYDVTLDASGYLADYRRIAPSDEAVGSKWYAYCVNQKESPWFNYQTYLDTMDEEAVAEFIKVTHERYKQVVGDRFDKSIPAIFSDEPNANYEKSMFPPSPDHKGAIYFSWSRLFEEQYQNTYGEDLLDKLPELAWNKRDGSDTAVKYRYFDFVAELFATNYSGQIGQWCEKNGIHFTGHYHSEAMLRMQSVTCGEVMRNYGKMGIPGIDMLCDFHQLTTAKQAQSAVHQWGKEGMLSELYGVTNWDYDFRGHKMQGDWQAALGVTVRVPHLAWLSMKGEAKRDFPATISYQSPWYKEYSYIENHFARLNTVLTRGAPIVKIGVIHPVESYWISSGPFSQTSAQILSLEDNFQNITQWLITNHLDFDFICESTLPGLSDPSSPLRLGKMTYDTIVVPGCLTLRKSTLQYLDRFRKNGGKVIFMGNCPTHIDGIKDTGCKALFENSTRISFDKVSLQAALEDIRCVRIINSAGKNETNLIYNYRQDHDCRWLFIACASDFGVTVMQKAQRDVVMQETLEITVKGEFIPTEYDTLSGDIKAVSYVHKNGSTVITYPFMPCNSILLKLADRAEATAHENTALTLVSEYSIKNTVDYTLSEPNVLLLDQASYSYDGGPWCESEEILRISHNFRRMLNFKSTEAQPYIFATTPAAHTLALRFTITSEIDVKGACLALEDADVAQITFNGQKVKNTITGYFTDESIQTVPLPDIKAGENTLTICFPFGERTNVEWCYILGDFGVRVAGCEKRITARQQKLGFGSITEQSLAFYSANVDYSFEVALEDDGAIEIEASYYRGALIAVAVDGQRQGRIVLPPYKLMIQDLKKGKHTVTLTLFGNRHNSFGALHHINEGRLWFGPDSWRTSGNNWCYEYRTRPLGILKSPIIRIYKK